jgi:iron-sulfur cluster repair protein YtfE (RIC family)
VIDTRATAIIRAEHAELLPHIEALRSAAEAVGAVHPQELAGRLAAAEAFLETQLIPHAMAEDQVLYPAIGRLMGAPRATATMSRDHVEVRRLADELRALRPNVGRAHADAELRRVLYGLYAVVKTHFAKEEEIYLPLIDEKLTVGDATELLGSMERAAAQIKAALSPLTR